MRGAKILVTLLAVGSLSLGAGLAMAATAETKAPEAAKTPAATAAPAAKAEQQAKGEKEVAPDRIARGEVTAVEVPAKTLTVKAMKGKQVETVGVEVPATAKITEGKATKSLADIKVGDRVWMKYDRMTDKLVADQIHILKPVHKAAKMESPKKSESAKKSS
jgi:hypothetical protein